jgi:hypothetical protein
MTRSPLAAAVLGTLLAGATLTACGGGGSDEDPAAAKTVSTKEFCSSIEHLDTIDTVAEAKKAVAGLGTPKDMPSDAAQGLTTFRSALDKVDASTKAEDLTSSMLKAMGGTSSGDVAKVQAFTTWVQKTCGS